MVKKIKFMPMAITLAEGGDKPPGAPEQIQLLRSGMFSYYSENDMEINNGHLLSMLSNFNNDVRGCKLAIDYSHNNQDKAAGWIKSLHLGQDGAELWANVDWTPEGKRCIEDKEFVYISAEFSYSYESSEGGVQYGPTLYGAGLTNRPFVKQMKPLIAMTEQELNMTLEELKAKVAEQELQLKNYNTKLAEKDSLIKANEENAAKTKLLAEKTESFNKMLGEGKVVEAQRAAFIEGDMVKFSELAGSIKLNVLGSKGKEPESDPTALTPEQAEDKILELAKVKFNENKQIPMHICIRDTMLENKKLAEKFHQKELPMYTSR